MLSFCMTFIWRFEIGDIKKSYCRYRFHVFFSVLGKILSKTISDLIFFNLKNLPHTIKNIFRSEDGHSDI